MKNFKDLQKYNQRLIKRREKLLEKEYIKAFKELDITLRDVYDRYEVDGQLNLDELYKYNRMKKLEKNTSKIVAGLYVGLDKIINKTLKEILETTEKESKTIINGRESVVPITKKLNKKDLINKSVAGRKWQERTKHHKDNFIYDTQTVIRKSMEDGDTYTTMAKNLKEKINKEVRKPKDIVRSEGHRIQEESKYEVMEEVGGKVKMTKTWNSVGDSRVRDTHQIMDGTTIGIDEEFVLPSGDLALYPGNSGNAAEDINCRCFLTYDVVEE